MHRIVFLDRETLRADVRRPRFEHEWVEHAATRGDEVVERLRGADIAVTNKVPLREAALAQLPALKLIAVAATGHNVVDVECCRRRGVAVANVPAYANRSVPEHVFALVLALRRKIVEYQRDVRGGAWQRARQFCLLNRPISELCGSTLGIVGYGELGRGVERIARGFGMRVLVAEHKGARVTRAGRVPFDEVLRASDVLTLHVPLTDETRNMIGVGDLAAMKSSALLINTARGGVVDEAALAEALRAGTIGGAGVDVLTEEPPRAGNPLLADDLPNLIVTPHVAWASAEAMQALADQLIDNIEAFVRGEPKNLVIGDG